MSPRRRSSKSMSMSGIETRSGLRNRSKSSPCAIGSSSVMPSAYAISAPAAEPRPGPTRMPSRLAYATQVGDHEEVAREAHLADRRRARTRPAGGALRHAAREPPLQPARDLLAQPRLLGLPLGHRELRHQVAGGEHRARSRRSARRSPGCCRRRRAPRASHSARISSGGLEVEVAGVELEPLRDRPSSSPTARTAAPRARRRRRRTCSAGRWWPPAEAQPLAQPQQVVADPALDVQAVVHQLEVEVAPGRRCRGTRPPTRTPARSRRCAARSGSPRTGSRWWR